MGIYYLDYPNFKTVPNLCYIDICVKLAKRGQKCHAKHLQPCLCVCVCPEGGLIQASFSTSPAHLCWRDFTGKYWFKANTEIFNHISTDTALFCRRHCVGEEETGGGSTTDSYTLSRVKRKKQN